MDKTFQKLLRTDIDFSPVGVERREDNNPYFCTLRGVSILGGYGWHPFLLCLRLWWCGFFRYSHELSS